MSDPQKIFERLIRPAFLSALNVEPHAASSADGVWSGLVRTRRGTILVRVSLDEYGGNLRAGFVDSEYAMQYDLHDVTTLSAKALHQVMLQALTDIQMSPPDPPMHIG